MMGHHGWTTATFLVCAGVSLAAQQPSLKEMARAQGGTAGQVVDAHSPVMELPALIADSVLVVHARVVNQRTTLNRDETIVMTEYTLEPFRIPLARSTESSARPGQVKIIVRRPGGTLSVDGLTLTTDVNDYPEEAALKTGEDALFFLSRDQDEGFYRPLGGPFGILRIKGGQTKPLTPSVARRRGDKPEALSDVLATVEKLGAAVRR